MGQGVPKGLKAARQAALEGRVREAVEGLGPFAARGDAAAAASLAEIEAFRGEWAGVLAHARLLVENPGSVYAANIFNDCVRLLGLCGHHGQPWSAVALAAQGALDALAGRPAPEHTRRRHQTILEALLAYARREGGPPHELIRVFGVVHPEPRAEDYRAAVAQAEKKPKKDARGQAWHLYALAVSFRQPEEILAGFEAFSEYMDFRHAADYARVCAPRGEIARAWSAIEPRLSSWYPVDKAQVAPIELIVDPRLAVLETPERWERVLATPRAGVGA